MGGLSALAWSGEGDVYHALADDPGEHGPPRLYRLRLAFEGSAPGVRVLSWTALKEQDGRPYAADVADPEGLVLLGDGGLLVASEGLADRGVAPFLGRFSTGGRELSRIELPARYLPAADGERGVRASLGFESLTLSADGRRLYLATEGPLAQDGPPADLGRGGLARILVLSWPRARPVAEHAYALEPVRLEPRPANGFRVAGLVELLELGGGRLLALERQFAVGAGFSLRLYAVSLDGATDLRRVDSLAEAPPPVPVCKEPLLDFAELELHPGNLEGLSHGPRLPDGRPTIVVVEDDNFAGGPAATFLRLALPVDTGRGSSRLPLVRRCW